MRGDAGVALAPRGTAVGAVTIPRLVASPMALAAIVLIGTALLLPRLGAQSIWLDESLTVGPAVTATSVADLVARVRLVDTQPPASHFLLWIVASVAPRTEFFYRLPSFVAVELGIVLLYVLARRLWGPMVAALTALAAQLSPYLCFYAAEARNYGLWFLCIVASALIAVRWWDAVARDDGRSAWGWTAALAAANALGLWTHAFHVFVVVADAVILGVAALSARSRPRAVAQVAVATLIAVALFAPWLVVLAGAARAGTAGVPWTRKFSWSSLGYHLFALHFGASLGPDLRALHWRPLAEAARPYAATLALAALAMGVTAITYLLLVRDALRDRTRRRDLLPLVAWPALTLVGPVAYAARSDFPLHPRHLMLAWPILPIVLALGLTRFRRLRPVVIAAIAVQVVALGNLLFDGRYAKDDERGAVAYATSHSGRVAYVLGDVAPLYASAGRPKNFAAFGRDTDDVWLVDNRTWEPENRRARTRLDVRMRALGMRYRGGTTRFHGLVLRHWTRAE